MDHNRDRDLLAAALTLAICSGGCASLAHGSRQQIEVDSQPRGARVFVGEKHVGTTPVSVHLWRHDANPDIRVEKEGFVTQVVRIKRGISQWIALDVVAGLNPGTCQGLNSASDCPKLLVFNLVELIGIDFATGAAFSFPSRVNVTLVPEAGGPPSAERTGAQATVIRLGS